MPSATRFIPSLCPQADDGLNDFLDRLDWRPSALQKTGQSLAYRLGTDGDS